MSRLDWPAPSETEGPIVIAHRGASGTFPENTEAAFLAALSAGVRTWECDIRLTRDATPVVIHDASLDRTTDGKGPVREMTLGEVRRLSAGYPVRFADRFARQKVPTLEEALRLARGEARLLIELKTDGGDADRADLLARAAVDQVTAAGAFYQTALVSFDQEVLSEASRLAPEIAIGLLVPPDAPSGGLDVALMIGARFLIVARPALSEDLSMAARSASMLLGTYTVNDGQELETVLPFGLYAVASDFPERLAAHPAVRRA